MEKIKERLRILIKKNGGNQAEIARQIGVEPSQLGSTLTDPKRGLSATIIIGLAKAGYDIQWLLTGQDFSLRISELETELRAANNLINSLERILGKK